MPRVTQDTARPHLYSYTGLSPSLMQLSRCFHSTFEYHGAVLQPRCCIATAAVWALPRSLATTGGIISLFSLPQGTKMFQFPWFASLKYLVIAALQAAGLSHSEIAGSTVICTYPALIAAYHVLHRLREPRHPPDALTFFRLEPNTLPTATTHKPASQPVSDAPCLRRTIRFAHTFSCKLRVILSLLT